MVALASAFVRLRPDPDRRAFRKAGEQMGTEAGESAGKTFGEGFTRGADGRLRDSRGKFVKDSEAAGEEAGRRTARAFSKAAAKGSDGTGTFGRVLATTTARMTLFGAAAAGAAPGVVHLTAAIAPALGSLVAMPAALGAVSVAMATTKLATAGVGKAIGAGLSGDAKKAEKALDSLAPAARRFAETVIALKPQVDRLKAAVSERFFRPLMNDIQPLAQLYFPLLRKEMSNLAGPLGGLGEQVAKSARSSVAFEAVRDLFQATRLSVINLRFAIDPLVKSFAALITATVPQLPRMADGIAAASQRLSEFITRAAGSGAVTRVFESSVQTIKDLGGIIYNVGSIIRSVFQGAATTGGGLLANIRALTGQAAAFLNTAEGFGAVSTVFAVLAKFGAALRTALAAVLPAVAQSLQAIGPAIAELAGPMAQIIVALAPLLPLVAGIAAAVLTRLTPALASVANYLADNAGLVKGLAIAATALFAVYKAGAVVMGVQAAGSLAAYVRSLPVAITLTKVFTGVQAALSAIMRLNPFVLAATALAALVAGLVVAYRNSEAFRKVVDAVWKGIKTAVQATVEWITGTALPAVRGAFSKIADVALMLWRNAILPAWNGIRSVIDFVIKIVRGYIGLLVKEFQIIAGVATWLWRNIFGPVFGAIRKVVEVAWLAISVVFKAWTNYMRNVIIPAVMYLRDRIADAFRWINTNIIQPWWRNVQTIFNAFRTFIVGPVIRSITTWRNLLTGVFRAVGATVRGWYTGTIQPIFRLVQAAWNATATAFSSIYNGRIKPLFSAFAGFIRDKVVGSFTQSVKAIQAAWNKVREYARTPVAFVVNKVINPFIGGLNKAASVVGIKDRVAPVTGFAAGGKISGAGGISDNRQAVIPGVGAVQLMGGEFVVNRQDTARALPLLRWINSGMKAGASAVGRMLGKPLANEPGDGSEGWSFAKGGLVGWAKDVWGAISDPVGTLKKPFESLLGQVPGAGLIKNFLVGGAKKLLGGAMNWLKGFGGSGDGTFAYHGPKSGRIGAAASFVRAQAGKPYIWADAGPRGYDCSGIVSAAYNVLKGRNPYSHTFSTGGLPGGFFKPGTAGPLVAGWSHPGQRPASASTGHMAGNIAGLAFESRGSKGVVVGSAARGVNQFANLGYAALARGGKIPVFDSGGTLAPGINVIDNRTGGPEALRRADAGGGAVHFHFHNSTITTEQAAEDLVVAGYNRAKRKRRIP